MTPLDTFQEIYAGLSAKNLHVLDDIYSKNIRFVDPAHDITGLGNLKKYFFSMYKNADSVAFTFGPASQSAGEAFLQWRMSLNHPRLASGKTVVVEGISSLQFGSDGKVFFHQDYFDLGAMLYENLPVLGSIIKTIKKRLGS